MGKEAMCGEVATWMNSPCNAEDHKECTSHYLWCDTCVPRDCRFCNEDEPDRSKWVPCIEIWNMIEEDMEECSIRTVEIDLNNCARCGQNHTHLLFRLLDNPLDAYKYWCLCPTNGQPILMKMTVVD